MLESLGFGVTLKKVLAKQRVWRSVIRNKSYSNCYLGSETYKTRSLYAGSALGPLIYSLINRERRGNQQ
jgi:hypothetical protein